MNIFNKIAPYALILLAIPNLYGADKDKEQKKSAAEKEAERKYFADMRKSLDASYIQFESWHQKQPVRTVAWPHYYEKNQWRRFKDLKEEEQATVIQAFGQTTAQTPCLCVDIELQEGEINVQHLAKLPATLYLPLPVLQKAQQTTQAEILRTGAMRLALSQEVFDVVKARQTVRATIHDEQDKIVAELSKLGQKQRDLKKTTKQLSAQLTSLLKPAPKTDADIETMTTLSDAIMEANTSFAHNSNESKKLAQRFCDLTQELNMRLKHYLLEEEETGPQALTIDQEDGKPESELPKTPVNAAFTQLAKVQYEKERGWGNGFTELFLAEKARQAKGTLGTTESTDKKDNKQS